MADLTIAKEIATQLGGTGRLSLMLGAYNFAGDANSLSFRIKNRSVNYVKIILNGKDLYDLKFGLIRGANFKTINEVNDVYVEDLRPTIEKNTGMYLSLGTMGKRENGGLADDTEFSKGGTIILGDIYYTTTGVPMKVLWYDDEDVNNIKVKVERNDEYGAGLKATWMPLSKLSKTKPFKTGGYVDIDVEEKIKVGDWIKPRDNKRKVKAKVWDVMSEYGVEKIRFEDRFGNKEYRWDYADKWKVIDAPKRFEVGGMVVTKISDIPNLQEEIDKGKVTYRGLGLGKKFNDFYNIAGEGGTSIKVKGKEYHITDTDFRKLNWDDVNKKWSGKIRFAAPYGRSYEVGGLSDDLEILNGSSIKVKGYTFNGKEYIEVLGTDFGGRLKLGKGQRKDGVYLYLSEIEWDDDNEPNNSEQIEKYVDDNLTQILEEAHQNKFEEGGVAEEEGVNLFEDYENIPENVQEILDKYSEDFEDGNYAGLDKALSELNEIGYTFDYYLDGQAYDLRKIGQKGKSVASEDDENYDDVEPFEKGGSIGDVYYMVHYVEKGKPKEETFNDLISARIYALAIKGDPNVKNISIRNHFKMAKGGSVAEIEANRYNFEMSNDGEKIKGLWITYDRKPTRTEVTRDLKRITDMYREGSIYNTFSPVAAVIYPYVYGWTKGYKVQFLTNREEANNGFYDEVNGARAIYYFNENNIDTFKEGGRVNNFKVGDKVKVASGRYKWLKGVIVSIDNDDVWKVTLRVHGANIYGIDADKLVLDEPSFIDREPKKLYAEGGEVACNHEEIVPTETLEIMVGRKLNGWNDNKVVLNGATFRKIYMRNEYKLVK